jgi:hypothetical protein
MSQQQNREIRQRVGIWASLVTALVLCAIFPDTVQQVTKGELNGKAAWSGLIVVFGIVAMGLEALQLGRNTRHRNSISDKIAREVTRHGCASGECPQATSPSEGTRKAALALFYTLVDQPSREVSFRNWGWYYSGVVWLWIGWLGFIVAVAGSAAREAPGDHIRGLASLALVLCLVVALEVWSKWRDKNLPHLESQLIQIRTKLAGGLTGVSCPLDNCPSR